MCVLIYSDVCTYERIAEASFRHVDSGMQGKDILNLRMETLSISQSWPAEL